MKCKQSDSQPNPPKSGEKSMNCRNKSLTTIKAFFFQVMRNATKEAEKFYQPFDGVDLDIVATIAVAFTLTLVTNFMDEKIKHLVLYALQKRCFP